MATVTIRGLDDETRSRLRVRAAENGRSMEAEVRAIIQEALTTTTQRGLGSRIHARFAPFDDGDLAVPERTDTPRAAPLQP